MPRAANGLQLLNLGVVPVATLLVPGITVREFLGAIGLTWMVTSSLAVLRLSLAAPRAHADRAAVGRARRELFRYGFPRVPGEVALGALFTLPVVFAAHTSGPILAGQIGLGLSLLQILGAIFAPLGQVLLPAISTHLARQELDAVRVKVQQTALRGILLAVVAVGSLELLCSWLFRRFFGDAYMPAVPLVRIIALAGIPYGTYVLLRSVLDAMHAQPMNARNLVYGILTFLLIAVIINSTLAVPLAIVAAMTVLGARTAYDVYHSLFAEQAR
jgi:O-antigen/teichoic acid export membrane protein